MDIATELDVIHKAGAWFSYDGNKIGQGRENTMNFLREHTDMLAEVEAAIMERKNSLVMASKKNKKEAALSEASEAAASKAIDSKPAASVVVEADDENFDEFTPAE